MLLFLYKSFHIFVTSFQRREISKTSWKILAFSCFCRRCGFHNKGFISNSLIIQNRIFTLFYSVPYLSMTWFSHSTQFFSIDFAFQFASQNVESKYTSFFNICILEFFDLSLFDNYYSLVNSCKII